MSELFSKERAEQVKIKPTEMPWPDPSDKDIVYVAWANYTKGFAAGYEAAKAKEQA
jgi:hypothetical protein